MLNKGDIVFNTATHRVLRVKATALSDVVYVEDPTMPTNYSGTAHSNYLFKIPEDVLAAIAPPAKPVKIDLGMMIVSVRYVRDHLREVFGVDPGLKPSKDIVDAMRANKDTAEKRWSELMRVYNTLTYDERKKLRGVLETAE